MSRVLSRLRSSALLLGAAAAFAAAAGCAGHGKDAIPSDAITLGSGPGVGRLNVAFPRSGTAYVLDKEADRVVWTGGVRGGDRLTVDGGSHQVTLNDRVVAGDVRRDHHYRVSYDTPYRP